MYNRRLTRAGIAVAAALLGLGLLVSPSLWGTISSASFGSPLSTTDTAVVLSAAEVCRSDAVSDAVAVTTTAVLSADFASSYKTGPLFARTDEVITYTIVAVNTGEPEQDVTLSDDPPHTSVFLPGRCYYRRQGSVALPCGPLDEMWREDFDTHDRITTTFAVRVWAGSMGWPLVNCAQLRWDGQRKEMCFTTVVNPSALYLPLVMRGYAPPSPPSLDLVANPIELTIGETSTLTATLRDDRDDPIAGMNVTFSTSDPLGSGALTPLTSSTNVDGRVTAALRSTVEGAVEVTAVAENGAADAVSVSFRPEVSCAPRIIATADTGPGSRGVALDTTGQRAFVAQASGVTVIDTAQFAVITEVHALSSAFGIAYDPDHNRVWVTTLGDEHRVSVLDGESYALAADFSADELPHSVAYNPANDRVYVTHYVSGTVGVYDAESMTFEQSLEGFRQPAHLGVNPETNKIYVADHLPPPDSLDPPNDSVVVIDGDSHAMRRITTSLLDAYGVAVDVTRNRIYVTAIAQGRFAIIDGATDEEMGYVDIRRGNGDVVPLRVMAVNPDIRAGGREHLLFVTSSEDGGQDQLVLIPNNGWFDDGQPDLGAPVPLDIAPYPLEGLALDQETDRAWVTSVASGTVSVVQDDEPLCSVPFSLATEGLRVEVFVTGGD